jgi:dTDP-4-dehydrorhamnose reductase
MRVRITGSNGLLGSKLLALLLGRRDVTVAGVSRHAATNTLLSSFPFWQADLAEPTEVASVFDAFQPNLVIHTAAWTDVDGCEREPDRAEREIVSASRQVASAAAAGGARLVHVSTDYVFDGLSAPYSERDTPRPINVYGRAKLVSEQVVRELLPRAVVARTALLFGHTPDPRPSFVSALLARNLAQVLWALGRDPDAEGLFHTAGATTVDRYSFARLIAATFGFDPTLVRPTLTSAIKQLAPRPPNPGLSTQRLRSRYPDLPILTAAEALRELRRQLEAAGRQFAPPRQPL